MAKVWMGPAGNIIKGHVLDSACAPLEQKLKEYDPQLYVRWAPKKLKGHGIWEIRRKPEHKSVKETVVWRNMAFHILEHVENNFDHHVLDVPFLNYDVLTKLKEMDAWQGSWKGQGFTSELEYKEAKRLEEIEEKAEAEKAYGLRQIRTRVRDLMEYTNSGGNPANICAVWDKADSKS